MFLKFILFTFFILKSTWVWINMDVLCKCMFIIIETIVNSMKTRHVSKVIDVFQRTCSCLDSWKKRNARFPLLLFLWGEQFTDTDLFKFSQDRAALLLNMQNVHLLFASVPTYCILILQYRRFWRLFEGKKLLKRSTLLLSWQHCASPILLLRVGPWVKQKIHAALIPR